VYRYSKNKTKSEPKDNDCVQPLLNLLIFIICLRKILPMFCSYAH